MNFRLQFYKPLIAQQAEKLLIITALGNPVVPDVNDSVKKLSG